MQKKVFFIRCGDYKSLSRKFYLLDGLVYPSSTGNNASVYANKYGELSESLGENFSVKVNLSGEIEIEADFCGFYPVFWMQYSNCGKEGVLISNCFHSISKYSNEECFNSIWVPSALSKNQFFSQNYTNDTYLPGIKRLCWDELIIVNTRGVYIRKKNRVIADDYISLIKQGINEAQSILIKKNKNQELNLYLSGGKDSRAVLAMLLSAGIIPYCSTQDPEAFSASAKTMIAKDFEIATSLSSLYGLDWYCVGDKLAHKIDFMESLEHHAYYRSGYYAFKPSQYLVYSKEWNSEVQLRGGGGELYKSFWGEYIKNSYLNNKLKGKDVYNDASILFDELVPEGVVANPLYQEAKETFIESIVSCSYSLGEHNIYNALDQHYINHRNRYHFGHLRASEAEGKEVFYPLINKFFYAASILLSEKERNEGKLIFDIIEACFPELNEYTYDSGYHHLLPASRSKKVFNEASDSKKTFYHVQSLNKKASQGIFKGNNYNAQKESDAFIYSSVKEAVERSKHGATHNGSLINYVKKINNNPKASGRLVSLFASLPSSMTEKFSVGHALVCIDNGL